MAELHQRHTAGREEPGSGSGQVPGLVSTLRGGAAACCNLHCCCLQRMHAWRAPVRDACTVHRWKRRTVAHVHQLALLTAPAGCQEARRQAQDRQAAVPAPACRRWDRPFARVEGRSRWPLACPCLPLPQDGAYSGGALKLLPEAKSSSRKEELKRQWCALRRRLRPFQNAPHAGARAPSGMYQHPCLQPTS